ncbi:MAG: DUF362 domain-containing protein [Verrucomicrobia bacterium]|nr:DUF362 domain-containing protein [Verrucomicrobiota bacterium]
MSSGSDARLSRRRFLGLAAATAGGIGAAALIEHWLMRNRQPATGVTIRRAASYSAPLERLIREGLQNHPRALERARGGRVLLKPNLIEYNDARRVNTHPSVVQAAVDAFRAVGAREVIVAEGPGHQRDTELLLDESGLGEALRSEKAKFVDLNLDSIHPVALPSNYTRLGRMFFPATALGADLIVSLPKLKTHHWAGVTLSLKNMFGVVPGVKYGWPKNVLHWRGIHESIVDIAVALKPGFAIVDGIEGMEGDGPLFGETVNAGVLIMGENLTAVDATATRVMGLSPERVAYLNVMLAHGGTMNEGRIRQFGETVASVRREFRVLEQFAFLKQPPGWRDFVRGL